MYTLTAKVIKLADSRNCIMLLHLVQII